MYIASMAVLEFGLKAYCVGDGMLCFMRCAIIWLLMIVSNTLAMIGRMDMGL